MQLVNETALSAELLSTVIDAERMTASLVARLTYAIGASPREPLWLAEEQPWKVSPTPWDSPQGKMEQDVPFMKGGVDLFVFGAARAPQGTPVSQMDVTVEVLPPEGDARKPFLRRAVVSGKRVWIRRDGVHLVPSAAAAFVEMPLTVANAFGGRSEWDGLDVPWMENPEGTGFVMFEREAEGAPLPHLEEPDAPMKAWEDRPPVCGFGFCPMTSPARFRNGYVISEDFEITDWRPAIFNTAYPPMIAPEARPGDVLRVTGVLHDGPLELLVPPAPATLRLQFGDKIVERTPYVDQIGVEVDARRVFVTYRFPFRYTVRPRELRRATLVTRKV
jgi:hypothetical protein